MKKKKVTAQAKRRMIVFGPMCIVIILYFLFTFFCEMNNIFVLKNEKASLENRYIDLQDDADKLKTEITKLKDPEYLAKYARENYYYSKDGELIIKLDKSKKSNDDDVQDDNKYETAMYISIFIVGIIFIYIFIRGLFKAKNKT